MGRGNRTGATLPPRFRRVINGRVFHLILFGWAVVLVPGLGRGGKKIRIALIGDSTVTDRAGWGKAFAERFGPDVVVMNFSVGGRSARSWWDEKRLPQVLEAKPDYVLIQFGHNGQPGKGPHRETDPATTYREFLSRYVTEFQKQGAQPILVSSLTRRTFDETGRIASTLTPWAEAAGAVAKRWKVPFVDLHRSSIAFHNELGPAASMEFNPREGDKTHLNRKGAEAIADLIIKELEAVAPGLSDALQ